MRRQLWVGLLAGGISAMIFTSILRVPEAKAQKNRDEANWEYKVAPFSYNPGERLTDEQRATLYEKTINEQARQGWEVVGSLLSRNVVQTVGGGVTTRDSISFVTYRRPRH